MSEGEPLAATEAIHPGTRGLDTLTTSALVETIVADNREAVGAVERATESIARAVELIVSRLRTGGSLHYIGAGSSGRLGALDAAEVPPTFGAPPELVQAHIAGGVRALTHALEGVEDDAQAGEALVNAAVRARDVVVGISASGGAPYVVAAVRRARALGAATIGLCNDGAAPLARVADQVIVLETGAEVLAGSTRLKAGTAQKLVLNALSTATLVQLGKVYDNLMVDVVAANEKLRRRAVRLVKLLVPADEDRAQTLLDAAAGSVKIAVVMGRRGVDAAQARALLDHESGFLRGVIG
ncbi:MAG TPA: N-acetylmuramic acid 6-phosphate etherase [Candidatus Acidoferrales bacterium]|nr:N-acetylmuramic acid 6-phosphate etherase [Candidatus Acidoferrales bacterium]